MVVWLESSPAQDSLAESQRRRRELEEYKGSVDSFQKWFEDMRSATAQVETGVEETDVTTEKFRDVQERLFDEASEYERRVRDVSEEAGRVVEGRSRDSSDEDEPGTTSEEKLSERLVQLSRLVKKKTEDLQERLASHELGTFEQPPLSYYRFVHGLVSDSDAGERAAAAGRSVEELRACWDRLNQQVDDKQTRLERTLEFQYLYQQAMQNVSDWLDDVELKLFGSGFDKSTEERLRENEALLSEIRTLHAEISVMMRASQQVMSNVSAENRALIELTLKVMICPCKITWSGACSQHCCVRLSLRCHPRFFFGAALHELCSTSLLFGSGLQLWFAKRRSILGHSTSPLPMR